MLYGHEWILPDDPGAPPILAEVTSTVNMKNIIHSHKNEVNKYHFMINKEASLKQKYVSSINTNYLIGLRDDDNIFAGVFAGIMMDYLYTNHINIKYKDVVENKHWIADPFDPT